MSQVMQRTNQPVPSDLRDMVPHLDFAMFSWFGMRINVPSLPEALGFLTVQRRKIGV